MEGEVWRLSVLKKVAARMVVVGAKNNNIFRSKRMMIIKNAVFSE